MSDAIRREFELSNDRLVVDPRSFGTRFWDSLQHPRIQQVVGAVSCGIILLWPGFVIFALIIQSIFWLACISKPDVLPIHLPTDANKIDRNDPKPGINQGFYKSRGSFFVGRVRRTGIEVWVSFKALTQHFLIFGTTGSGKTESIISYLINYLAVGSGVAFQDAKAAPKAMMQVATYCRIFARDLDFRVTNYITGLSASARDPAERISNDAAVFAKGNAESNTQLLVSLMPPSGGDNKIFAERAVGCVSAEMPALTDLRELGVLQIDPGVIRKYMAFKNFVALFRDNRISKKSRDALQAFLESLPGYDETVAINEQPEEVTRQFGFAQAYFTRSLSSLSDTYGHIYLVGQGEIDYQDAVLNGRVLLTLLPSMEKSGEELSSLGKIVLTATKNGMVVGLGTIFEGSADDIVHNLPTNSDIPYGVFNDENAYMLVEGQEMINAQARGLGFGVLTATQDAPGMLEGISKTTKQIMANSAFKQIQYLDDKETIDLAIEFGGDANVQLRNFERDGAFGNLYTSKNTRVEKVNRLTSTAIKAQGIGQAFLMYQGKVHEIQVFNHGIQEKSKDPNYRVVDNWFSVRLAKVRVPRTEDMMTLIKVNPRKDWKDMMLMLTDESLDMLDEMNIYFQSMLTINNVARMYQNNNEMLDASMQVFAANSILDQSVEPPTGISEIIAKNRPGSYKDTLKIFAELARNSKSGHVAVKRMGDEAGIDDILGLDMHEEEFVAKTGTNGGSSSAGGLKATPTKPEQSTDSIIDGFLAGMTESSQPDLPIDLSSFESPNDTFTEEPVVRAPRPERPMTDIANAVEQNLAAMPWMANQIDYSTVKSTFVQAEMLFNGGDVEKAEATASIEFDHIADSIEYPKNPPTKDGQTQSRARAVLKGLID